MNLDRLRKIKPEHDPSNPFLGTLNINAGWIGLEGMNSWQKHFSFSRR